MNSSKAGSAGCTFLGILVTIAVALICPGCSEESGGPVNRAPVITELTAVPERIEPLESSTLSCTADDPDGDALTYEWDAEFGTLSGSGASVSWTATEVFDTCLVTVTVSDGHGGTDEAEVRIEVPEGTLLVQTVDGLAAVRMDGTVFLLPSIRGPVEALGTRVFAKSTLGGDAILEINPTGTVIGSMMIPSGVSNITCPAVLPDGGFAFFDNGSDSVHFVDSDGGLIGSIAMPNGNTQQNQVVDGVVVGTKLVVSENGNDQLFSVDLGTYEAVIFRDLAGSASYLSGIDYSRGWYFLCDSNDELTKFTDSGEVTSVSQLSGVLIAVTVVGDYAYVTAANGDRVYKVNIHTGDSAVLVEGLNSPEDIEYVPVVMEPPVTR